MVTFRNVYEKGLKKLSEIKTEDAAFDCKVIFETAFGVDFNSFRFSDSFDNNANNPDEKKAESFFEMIEKRCEGYPLQYLAGDWEFFGLPFKVGEGVLVPRQDTETLVEFALSRFKEKKNLKICDLCAGSGCIGIALEKNLDCQKAVCVELSENAFCYLEENIRLNNSNVTAVKGDVLDESFVNNLNKTENFDLIVSNPPYLTKEDMNTLQKEVSFEPEKALFGGDDGCDFYRGIVRLWKNRLNDGGMMIFEIGIGQEDEVSQILIQNGFKNVRFKADLCGINRIVYGEKIFLEND